MKKCSLIYNPVSSGFSEKTLKEVSNVISNKGYDLDLLESKRSGHVVDLVRAANDSDLTISMGGDGTVGEAIRGYKGIEQNSLYSHISTGTTNDMAANFRLLKDNPVKSAEMILNGNPCGLDIVSVNDEVFAYVSCFGFLTNVPYETSYKLKKNFGNFGYVMRAFSHDMLKKIPKYKISYTIDGIEKDADCILGIVSNSNGFAGIDIYKDVNLEDGLFEVLLVHDINLKSMLKLIREYFKNSVDLTKYSDMLTMTKTDNLKIEFLDKTPVYPVDNDGDMANFKLDENNRCLQYRYEGKVKMLLPKNIV